MPACITRCLSPLCKVDPETGVLIPRPAADGLRLCRICTRRLAEDAILTAVRYNDLALVLTATGGMAERVATSADPNLSLNEAAANARTRIRHTLVAYCRMISEERGISLPGGWLVERLPLGFIGPPNRVWRVADTVPAMSRYVAKHAEWLAAHDAADEWAAELNDIAQGEAKRISQPSGSRKFPLRTPAGDYAWCPQRIVVDEDDLTTEPCPGSLWSILRRDNSLMPSEIVCNHDDSHRWPTSQWLRLGADLLGNAA